MQLYESLCCTLHREQANLNVAYQLWDVSHGLTESKWALLHVGCAAYRRLHLGHRCRHDHAAAIQSSSPRGWSRLGHLCLLHLHEGGQHPETLLGTVCICCIGLITVGQYHKTRCSAEHRFLHMSYSSLVCSVFAVTNALQDHPCDSTDFTCFRKHDPCDIFIPFFDYITIDYTAGSDNSTCTSCPARLHSLLHTAWHTTTVTEH